MPSAGRLRGGVSRKAKLLTEAPVKGGRNYDGSYHRPLRGADAAGGQTGVSPAARGGRHETRLLLERLEDPGYPDFASG